MKRKEVRVKRSKKYAQVWNDYSYAYFVEDVIPQGIDYIDFINIVDNFVAENCGAYKDGSFNDAIKTAIETNSTPSLDWEPQGYTKMGWETCMANFPELSDQFEAVQVVFLEAEEIRSYTESVEGFKRNFVKPTDYKTVVRK